MDSDQSSMQEDDSRCQFYEYLNYVLSDFPPLDALYLATNPEFVSMLLGALEWYEYNMHISEELSDVYPQLLLAVTHGREFLCRILCCAYLERSRFSCVKVYSPRLILTIEEGVVHFLMQTEVEKSDPYVVRPGQEHITDTYRELLDFLDHSIIL
ncbi:hypothetical protein M758_7G082800 [Ceratodon purpureus]|nr:hypothetical protein M758_7G082800 [Ceratodon purpureus]